MTKFEQVPANKTRWHCDLAQFTFKTTDELKRFSTILGQDRAVRSINAGLAMNYAGYNIFVSGASGTGRATTVKLLLQQRKKEKETPKDICYVNNFKNPDLPVVLTFASGQGCQFKNDMEALVDQLQNVLPQIFESDRYHQKRDSIENKFNEQQKKKLEEFEKKTASKHFTLVQIQVGPYTKPDIFPVIKDQPVPLEEASGPSGHAIFGLGEQTPRLHRSREQVVVGTRVRPVEPGRQDDHSPPSPVDRPLMCRPIDPNGTTRHDNQTVEHRRARERVRKIERLIIGPPRADDGEGASKVGELTHDAKLDGRIGEVAQASRIPRARGRHQACARPQIPKHHASISTAHRTGCVPLPAL